MWHPPVRFARDIRQQYVYSICLKFASLILDWFGNIVVEQNISPYQSTVYRLQLRLYYIYILQKSNHISEFLTPITQLARKSASYSSSFSVLLFHAYFLVLENPRRFFFLLLNYHGKKHCFEASLAFGIHFPFESDLQYTLLDIYFY